MQPVPVQEVEAVGVEPTDGRIGSPRWDRPRPHRRAAPGKDSIILIRGPNYPKLNLEEAIEQARHIYQEEHRRVVPKEVVAQLLGYKGLNGSSARVISALKHYGLLEEPERDKMRVSDDGMTVFELPRDESERIEALRRMAFAPQVLTDLQDHYEGSPPNSDVGIRHYLLRKKFLPQAADEVIRLYRDNLHLVAEQAPEYHAEVVEDGVPEVESPVQPTQEARAGSGAVGGIAGAATVEPDMAIPPATVLQFKISGSSAARIELTGDVTQEAIDRLAKILDVQKFVFPSEEEQAAVEQAAEQTSIIEMPDTE